MKIFSLLKLSIQSHLRSFISMVPSFIAFESKYSSANIFYRNVMLEKQESKSRKPLKFNECNFENWNCYS